MVNKCKLLEKILPKNSIIMCEFKIKVLSVDFLNCIKYIGDF